MIGTRSVTSASATGYVRLAAELKEAVATGRIPVGECLPPAKRLAAEYGVSSETARRAAKRLEREGWVVSLPRHGFRVLARANDPDRGLPVAFVVGSAEKPELWSEFYRLLFAGLQKAAADRGWSILAVGIGQRSGLAVMDQLRACRACGMVVDAEHSELIDLALRAGMPVVMMDAWETSMRVDAVVQDSFQGALVATKSLTDRGHERIGWLGPISGSTQNQERFGGYCAAMAAAGLSLRPEYMRDTLWPDVDAAAHALLSGRNRPTAALGLWQDAAAALVRAARQLELKPKDVEIVGWTPEEQYEGAYRTLFPGAARPAAMAWSIAELTRLTVAQLARRRADPKVAPTFVKVPTRLIPAEKTFAGKMRQQGK